MVGDLSIGLRPYRALVLGGIDGVLWVAAMVLFAAIRLDTVDQPVPWGGVLTLGLIAALLQFVAGWAVRLHHGRAPLGSLEEMILLGGVTVAVGATVTGANAVISSQLAPRSVPLAALFTTLALAAAYRAVARYSREPRVTSERMGAERVLIIGAGRGGQQLLEAIRADAAAKWTAVGFLDDDYHLRHRRIRGVPVRGTIQALEKIAVDTDAESVIIAIPSADSNLIQSISTQAGSLGLRVRVLPSAAEIFDSKISVSDVRDIDVTDLLGRRPVDTNLDAIAHYIADRRVLITGAGGSIGSELARQITRYGPRELIMLDRDESALHAVQLSIHGQASLGDAEVVLADIRDHEHLTAIFEKRRPDVVFHAAALKHLNILEQYPAEAVKTNVLGTRNVLAAAARVGVGTFVNISTDKAADPQNVLGYTKRLAECMTASYAAQTDGKFISVRFGNVLGSRGSVLTAFTAQIAAGGPVTVTHPEVTRYFMTAHEAVQLVIQAAAIGHDAEALVLDMGSPVRIRDVAEQLIELSASEARIVYTGLRPGEKMHESLLGGRELDQRPEHPLVSHVPVPAIDSMEVGLIPLRGADEDLKILLREMCEQVAYRPAAHPDFERSTR